MGLTNFKDFESQSFCPMRYLDRKFGIEKFSCVRIHPSFTGPILKAKFLSRRVLPAFPMTYVHPIEDEPSEPHSDTYLPRINQSQKK